MALEKITSTTTPLEVLKKINEIIGNFSNYQPTGNYLTSITSQMIVDALGYTPPKQDTTYSQATSNTLGLVKIGFAGSGKKYPVELNESGQMFVNVPWENTTYDLSGYAQKAGTNTFTGKNIFTNGLFEIRAKTVNDDSWINLTNATDSGYYAFGIRRPYATYGLQMKIHNTDGTDQYLNIYHAGNYTKIPTATTTTPGLMSATMVTNLNTLTSYLSNADNNYVDTLAELLAIFDTYPQGTDIVTLLSQKVDKVDGKVLSSNDFTGALLEKLNGIEAGANKYVLTKEAITTALGYTPPNGSFLPLSGGTLNDGAGINLLMYGQRYLKMTGNGMTFDMSAVTGGWAGNFVGIKDPAGDTTPMLGYYGGDSGLTHIFMGGTYSDPFMKMTKAGAFTFKYLPTLGTADIGSSSKPVWVDNGVLKEMSYTPIQTIKAASGTNINSIGTPTVTAAQNGSEVTFTFDYLKGAKGDTGASIISATITEV